VQRLEQVRLPSPVVANCQHETRAQLQVKVGVGAVVAERECLDDQP
jgi:hypothetical protein